MVLEIRTIELKFGCRHKNISRSFQIGYIGPEMDIALKYKYISLFNSVQKAVSSTCTSISTDSLKSTSSPSKRLADSFTLFRKPLTIQRKERNFLHNIIFSLSFLLLQLPLNIFSFLDQEWEWCNQLGGKHLDDWQRKQEQILLIIQSHFDESTTIIAHCSLLLSWVPHSRKWIDIAMNKWRRGISSLPCLEEKITWLNMSKIFFYLINIVVFRLFSFFVCHSDICKTLFLIDL